MKTAVRNARLKYEYKHRCISMFECIVQRKELTDGSDEKNMGFL